MHVFYGAHGPRSRALGPNEEAFPLVGVHRAVTNPVEHVVPSAALPSDAEVGPGVVDMVHPVVRHDVQVGTAHDYLPKHLEAVIYQ